MKTMFDPIKIGAMTLPNRMIRSAVLEMGTVEDGRITFEMAKVFEELATKDIGLIITGMMGVDYNSCHFEGMARMYADDFASQLKPIVDHVHSFGTKIVVQLGHCGCKSTVIDKGDQPYAPSVIETAPGKFAKEMTEEEIDALVAAYGEAARKCKEAGADGVQIHGAHGYLISQFISPYYNKRTDKYGGTIENRARVLFDACRAIQKAAGKDYPLLVKINCKDLVDETITLEECVWVCKELEKMGVLAVEISAGVGISSKTSPAQRFAQKEENEAYFSKEANVIADQILIPVISVGGYRTPSVIERVLNEGNIAGISLGRPLILQPCLIKRWKDGNREKAQCISCSRCFLSEKHGCKLKQRKEQIDAAAAKSEETAAV